MSLSTKTSGNRVSWLAAMVLLTLFLFAALACIPPASAHDGPEQAARYSRIDANTETKKMTMYKCGPGQYSGELESKYVRGAVTVLVYIVECGSA